MRGLSRKQRFQTTVINRKYKTFARKRESNNYVSTAHEIKKNVARDLLTNREKKF